MSQRSIWGTRLGFYLAAIGSSFGLGNLWRFPYIVAENGGGAFVLLYVFLAFLIGFPLLIGELALGKLSRRSLSRAASELSQLEPALSSSVSEKVSPWKKRLWVLFVSLALFSCTMVFSYYAVISGWVLFYLIEFALAQWGWVGLDPQSTLETLRNHGWLQILMATVHLGLTGVIVFRGVQKGIEKWVGYMVPVFLLLLVVLVFKSLALPTSDSALRFLFYPDFSKLNWSSLGQALGHVFFTLSIGFGTMVTFGSYLPKETVIPKAGFRVTALDSVISLFAGLLIFPILLGTFATVNGPEVLFRTLPLMFYQIPGGLIFGTVFFLCLYLAALGASIGLLETMVSNLCDRWQWSRRRATWGSAVLALGLSFIPALSSSVLRGVRWEKRELLVILDSFLINWLLPTVAFLLVMILSYSVNNDLIKEQFFSGLQRPSLRLYNNWRFVVRWLAPLLILSGLIFQTFGLWL